MGFFQFGFEWKEAGKSMLNTLRTTFFPAVVWATIANSIFVFRAARSGVGHLLHSALTCSTTS
jgi:hypothetical protein